MAEWVNVQGLDIPDDRLPIALGQVYLPRNLHKFLRIKDREEVTATHGEILQLITCFHPSTHISGNISNPQSVIVMFQWLVLPWILSFESMDYETNIMKFSNE
ncbi:uncharacterized protein MELLADRAFT_106519 [Melampsora larici-populina 98AG31]|uniref:Uncharacterized protein n=1 Tax=Melampsora larici-populina (strain 98AG31 / pathotype 3-4-7) TaxID=747676 RepID=F4RLS1_MELLP|nr:uncharacterized protein MELLADRAFT_106519 [Melampsora larici-populina 98AG31]EGG06586.1 hypothetical protein MELLADRAFT_106519 [Melampsora larici-populina 98AG31]